MDYIYVVPIEHPRQINLLEYISVTSINSGYWAYHAGKTSSLRKRPFGTLPIHKHHNFVLIAKLRKAVQQSRGVRFGAAHDAR